MEIQLEILFYFMWKKTPSRIVLKSNVKNSPNLINPGKRSLLNSDDDSLFDCTPPLLDLTPLNHWMGLRPQGRSSQ